MLGLDCWPTADQVAIRVGVALDVPRSSLRRLQGRDLVEHDGLRPRGWTRTRDRERTLGWAP